jgi:hypothetical protein
MYVYYIKAKEMGIFSVGLHLLTSLHRSRTKMFDTPNIKPTRSLASSNYLPPSQPLSEDLYCYNFPICFSAF